MKAYKCQTCGGELIVSPSGELECPYCGLKYYFTQSELSEYTNHRRFMYEYLKKTADSDPDAARIDQLWSRAAETHFTVPGNHDIAVRHLFFDVDNGVEMYTARRNVLFLYPAEQRQQADTAVHMPATLQFPSADVRDLARCFPVVSGQYTLTDGRRLVAYSKPESLYPLSAFGALPPEHVAWVISRLENICCALAYSNIAHERIRLGSIFINARTHEAALLGGWWNVHPCTGGSNKDLADIRTTAMTLLGPNVSSAPPSMLDFLKGNPAANAFDDFALWDTVIERGFGGRRFVRLNTEFY